jgi:hypothetical protein
VRPSRRIFLTQITALGASAQVLSAMAQSSAAQVDEASETAVALGYLHDTTKVDSKKYPQHQAAQRCVNCSFWQGKPDAAWAGCAMFGRKQVAAAGWCQVWAKVPG